MRLTAVLVALSLLLFVGTAPAAMARSTREGHPLTFADPQDLPAASSGFPAPEAYQSKSEGDPRISEEYTSIPEGLQDLSLTVPRRQSVTGFLSSALGRGASALVSSIPALLMSAAGMLGALCFSCLSLPALLCSLPLGLFLACAGAVVLGALGLIAGPFFGALAGLILGPIVLFFLSGVCGLSLGFCINTIIALIPSEFCAICYGCNTAACCIPWFFQILWLMLSWIWITFGGFGWGMICFTCISVPCTSIMGLGSACSSAIPLCGWLPNWVWLCVYHLIFTACMILYFMCFDWWCSIVLPILVLIGDISGLSPACLYDLFDIFSGCLYLCFDCCGYMPVSLCFYFTALCTTLCGIIPGWIAQCCSAPCVSGAAGALSGLACTILFTVVNLLLGVVIGPPLGCFTGCIAGPVAGAAFGCASGLLAPCLIPLITMAAAAMSGCVSLLSLASCLAEATGTSDVLLSLLVFLRDFLSSVVRLILGALTGLALSLMRFLDGCLGLAGTYCNLTGTFFELCYMVLAVCAPLGVLSPCCTVSCCLAGCMVCTFCVQILWNVLYHLTGSFRSCSSCALGALEAVNGRLVA